MPDDSIKSEFEFYSLFDNVPYTDVRQDGNAVRLRCSLYLPRPSDARPPLFVWFHGGAFKFGNHRQKMSQRLGRRLAKSGIAFASVQYRLRGTFADLTQETALKVEHHQTFKSNLIRPGLCEFRSLVALQDGVGFLAWASSEADRFGWSEKRILGGTSAGGITAFNIVFGATNIGLSVPEIHGVFACSGGFNYPALVHPRPNFRALALHNPLDDRVSIKGVRMLRQKLDDRMELLESESHIHGHCELNPGEPRFKTFKRITDFVDLATR